MTYLNTKIINNHPKGIKLKIIMEKTSIDFKTLHNRPINGGVQYLFKANNGYGASIVQHSFSYGRENGTWELAVITYKKPDEDIYNFNLCYSTDITDDVLGDLSDDEVNEVLERIIKLKPLY